jgi:hypothetical protein
LRWALVCVKWHGAGGDSGKPFDGHTVVFVGWAIPPSRRRPRSHRQIHRGDRGAVNYICINDSYDTKITAMIAAGERSTCP